MTTISIGDLVLPEILTGSNPKGFFFNSLKDWYSLPASKAPAEGRPGAHGNFDGGVDWREAVTPSVEGGYVGSSRADAFLGMEILNAIGDGQNRIMRVTDELRSTSREVSIRFVSIPDHHGRRWFTFSIDMLADDPRRYGDLVSVSTGVPNLTGGRTWPATWPITWGGGGSDGRVIALNPGRAETYSLLEVTGGLGDGFSITEVGSGREIRYEQQVPLGSTVFLNPRTGAVYIDAPGNDKSGALTRDMWPAVPPQGQSILQFNPLGTVTGTPTLTARTAPAYW